MKLYWLLAWRNIWRHKRRTLIVVASIGMSLAMMMMYDGLMVGFNDAIYANAVKILGGNVQVHADGYRLKTGSKQLLHLNDDQALLVAARALPEVEAASRRINTGGIVTNRTGAFSVTITGLEPEVEQSVSLVSANITSGRDLTNADQDMVLIGQGLADAMEAGVGDRITMAGSDVHNQTVQRTMMIVGIYDVGLPEIERRTIYISLDEAGYLFGLNGKSTEIALFLEKLGQESEVIRKLNSAVPGYEIDSWVKNFPEMSATIERKNSVMDVFGVIILAIAGIGIMNMLLMSVFERTREIGVLGALGIKPRQISWMFILEGAMMGLVGLIAGVVLGLIINSIFSYVGFDYSEFSNMTSYTALIKGRVYSTLGLEKIWQRVLTVLVISVISSLYPARTASLKEPAAALHTV
jgi:ABC-type lipoprotein release transport system permease subunit